LGVAFSWRLAGLAALAAGLSAAVPATASAGVGGAAMFTHSAKSGELGGGRLTLRGIGRRVTWVTNDGRSGVVTIRRLHRRLFLPRRPATGTLHVAGHRGGDEPTFRLSRPRYNASRRTVSYRIKRLNGRSVPNRVARAAQSPAPDPFGAASLSIVGHPQVMSGDNGGHDCGIGLVNETGYGVQAASELNWDTDTWDPGIPFNDLVPSHSKEPTGADTEVFWESDGGFLRGCSNTAVWVLTVDPNDPTQAPPPSGVSFTLSVTYPWNGSPTPNCTSTNPQFYCVRSSGDFWLLRGPVPCCMPSGTSTASATTSRR
jgi:hypothetical protein